MNAPLVVTDAGTALRRLAGLERFTALGSARFNSCFDVVAMLELEGPVTADRLRRGAERLQRQYQCLQVEVIEEPGETGHFFFRTTSQGPQIDVVDGAGPEAWRAVWRDLTRTTLPGLAWRLVWVRPAGSTVSQLLISCHHAIFDIHSASLFFSGLLESMHADLEGIEPRAAPAMPLSGALPKLVGARWPVGGLLRVAWKRVLGKLRGLPLEPPTGDDQRREWHGLFRELPPDATRAIVSRCRTEGVTVGQALSAALLLEVADRVRAAESTRDFGLAVTTTLDLRRFLGHDAQTGPMGMLVGAVHTYYQPKADDTAWSLGRAVKANLSAAIGRNEHRDMIRFYDLMGPTVARWLANQNQGRPAESNLVVSNFGQLEGLDRGPFKARRFYITAAQSLLGATLLVASGTLNGSLFLHLGYPHPSVSDQTAEAFIDAALARLEARAARELDGEPATGQNSSA